MSIKHYLVVVTLLFAEFSFGSQMYEANDGDSIAITISADEVTRVSIDGNGRISKVRGGEGIVNVTPDKEEGDIYIRPITNKANFSFFIKDSYGNNYTIKAHQTKIPSQSVVIKPKNRSGGSSDDQVVIRRFKELPLTQKVKELAKAMASEKDLSGYEIETEEKPVEIKRWKEVFFGLYSTYIGRELKGEVFVIRNITSKKLTFHEKEFLDVGKGVVATGISKLVLEPNESTYVYVVRRNGR